MAAFAINPPNTPIVMDDGRTLSPIWYRWFAAVQRVTGDDLIAQLQAAPYLTYTPSATLTADKVLTQGAGLSFTSAVSTFTIALAVSGVAPGTYGSAGAVSQITVDQYGRLTVAADVAITPAAIGAVPIGRLVTAGGGLAGGGDLSADRMFDVGAGVGITVNANDVALDTASTRNTDHAAVTLTAGSGLTGGGTIAANRTFDVGAGTGITVNANDVALDTASTRNTDHASVTVTAGAGLTGGGDITANRTFDIGAGSGITVNANDVALTVLTAFGTYTPTLTGVANVAASTAFQCQYMRVGNVVTVSGSANIDPTALAATQLGISLPVASNFGAFSDCAGTGVSNAVAGQAAAVYADDTNDRAQLEFTAVDITNRTMIFTFTYLVI